MKYFNLLLIFILFISCNNRNERIINDFVLDNYIPMVNLSKRTIDDNSVLKEFDQKILNEYGFSFPTKDNIDFDIEKIKYTKDNSKKITRISKPIFSKDRKYCLIQIAVYEVGVIPDNPIYLLEKKGKRWELKTSFIEARNE